MFSARGKRSSDQSDFSLPPLEPANNGSRLPFNAGGNIKGPVTAPWRAANSSVKLNSWVKWNHVVHRVGHLQGLYRTVSWHTKLISCCKNSGAFIFQSSIRFTHSSLFCFLIWKIPSIPNKTANTTAASMPVSSAAASSQYFFLFFFFCGFQGRLAAVPLCFCRNWKKTDLFPNTKTIWKRFRLELGKIYCKWNTSCFSGTLLHCRVLTKQDNIYSGRLHKMWCVRQSGCCLFVCIPQPEWCRVAGERLELTWPNLVCFWRRSCACKVDSRVKRVNLSFFKCLEEKEKKKKEQSRLLVVRSCS